MASDGVKQRDIVHQVTSAMTGPIIVEDVVYDNADSAGNGLTPSKDLTFRRLTFERSMGLVQSEALLTSEGCSKDILIDTGRRKNNSSSKSKRKGSQRKDSRSILNIDHNYLASSYHIGIISGFMLVSSKLERVVSSGRMMKTVIIGLGAGLLPMFLRGCMPCLDIEVVELDSIVLNLARDYFSFTEDKQLKVHIVDGIKFVREVANVAASSSVSIKHENEQNLSVPNGNGSCARAEGQESSKIDILIIDADSADSSSGMTCPPANFVEESFLLSVKESLSEGGLFVINLVSRSQAVREMVVSRMKTVFCHLFCLQLEEDVNEILFALPVSVSHAEDGFSEAALHLQKLLKFTHPERGQNILDTIKKIKCLK